jgi:hypothetical protein
MNRRATWVLVATFGAALAVMFWLISEMRTAAGSAGPPPVPATTGPPR